MFLIVSGRKPDEDAKNVLQYTEMFEDSGAEQESLEELFR